MGTLIVTADDFGLSQALNSAVARAHDEGILRYASLMVDAPAVAPAVALAHARPGLGVGLHLDLCRADPAAWGARYFFSPTHRRRVEGEIRRQFETFLSLGLNPSHADAHFNIHVHPVIFPALARACREFGAPRIRLPAGEASVCWAYGGGGGELGRMVQAAVFGVLGALLRPRAAGVRVPERCFGLLRSGLMREDYVLALLDSLAEAQGETELYFHPSSDPSTRATLRPTPDHHTIVELETLLSPRVRAKLESLRLTLSAPRVGG